MPQGKLKVKAKVPAGAKTKKKATKGSGVTKRANKPIAAKKQKQQEAQKLKKAITKTVNQAMEEELRSRALDGRKSLLSKKKTPATPPAASTKPKRGKKK